MNITTILTNAGFPTALIREYVHFFHELLPLQQRLIETGDLFSDKHLLIHAPTSAGKSFLAELAMVHTAVHGRKSIYLAPLRVQAEEIYQTLRKRYEPHGIQILISTRDHRYYDPQLEQGSFHIAVVVYEKMFQIIARQPSLIGKIHLVVFDDIDLIFDAERGITADFLMTRWFSSPCRRLALSACLPQAKQLATWMHAQLIHSEQRPIPLRKGVLYNHIFSYRDTDDNDIKEETLMPSEPDELTNPLLSAVQHLTNNGETCLIFLKSRGEVRSLAWELSNHLNLPPATHACEHLQSLEPTRARNALLHTFQHGVAFHYSDLLPEERYAVEESLRQGEVRVLVATSTLAKGLNLPVNNVFISHEKWYYGNRNSAGGSLPLSLTEFENMAGRAGRYGYTQKPGRAILIANSEEEKNLLLSWYILQSIKTPFYSEETQPNESLLVNIIASYQALFSEQIEQFFKSTWKSWQYLQTTNTPEIIKQWTRNLIDSAVRRGFCVTKTLHQFTLTPRGQLIATKGVSPNTVEQLEQWLLTIRGRDWDDTDALLICALTPDGWLPQFEITRNEIQSKIYIDLLNQCECQTPWDVITPFQKFRQRLAEPEPEEVRAIKVSLVLREWIRGTTLTDIEETYSVSAGQIIQAGLRIAWICDVLSQLAELMHIEAHEQLRSLAEQVHWGTPAEMLSLAHIGSTLLTRSQIITLYKAGITDPQKIHTSSLSELKKLIPEETAIKLKQRAKETIKKSLTFTPISKTNFNISYNKKQVIRKATNEKLDITPTLELNQPSTKRNKIQNQQNVCFSNKTPLSPPSPIKKASEILLAIDEKRPGEVWLEGKRVRLPEKQYRLLHLLSQNAGRCVSYDEVYKELWGDIVVEDGQIAFQKCMLVRALSTVSDRWKNCIRTIPKRGLILDLLPQQIALNCGVLLP
ncbi:MAG TPA: DEAD/DEAH box helicase [Candidatus Hydrogenedens sp.]|nr:DEAD/DEAH box helicase [Candidatus Hydrogenedens sp.]